MNKQAFSMIEMMITVVIISSCLVLSLRVFSVCAAAVSDVYNTNYAIDILRGKIALLKLSSITQDGIDPESLSFQEEIGQGVRIFNYTQDIVEWETTENLVLETTKLEQGDEEAETETEKKELGLCVTELNVNWGGCTKEKKITLKSFFPVQGVRHEF